MNETKEGVVTATAKVFWRTRQFWLVMLLIMSTCILIGYLIGNYVFYKAYGMYFSKELQEQYGNRDVLKK